MLCPSCLIPEVSEVCQTEWMRQPNRFIKLSNVGWIWILIGLPSTLAAQSEECVQGKIRLSGSATAKAQPAAYCYGDDAETLHSRSCRGEGSQCRIRKAIQDLASKLKASGEKPSQAVDKMDARELCASVEARLERVEFEVGARWFEVLRCHSKADESFVDIAQVRAKLKAALGP